LLTIGFVYLLARQIALVNFEKIDKVTWALREAGSKQVLTTIVT
jgi:hypothetical protein